MLFCNQKIACYIILYGHHAGYKNMFNDDQLKSTINNRKFSVFGKSLHILTVQLLLSHY